MSALVLAWCIATLAAAGVVKGVLGIGLPLVSLSLLSFVLPLPVAAALLPVPMIATNVWQSVTSGYLLHALRRFWPLLIAMWIGTFAGAHWLADVDLRVLNGVVGAVVALFSVTVLWQPRLSMPPRAEPYAGLLAGGLGGLLGGISTLFGPPILIFLSALELEKNAFVGCVTTIYLVSSFAVMGAFLDTGVMGRAELVSSALATVPLFLGMLLGERLRGRLDETRFRRLLLLVLLFSGVRLLWRAASGD